MQPVIGITTYHDKDAIGLPIVMIYQAYVQAIMQAGGVPILLPSVLAESGWDILYERLDGILLAGGGTSLWSISKGMGTHVSMVWTRCVIPSN